MIKFLTIARTFIIIKILNKALKIIQITSLSLINVSVNSEYLHEKRII